LAVTHPEEIHLEPVTERHLPRALKVVLAFVAGAAFIAAALAIAWTAYERVHENRAYPGVSVAGVALGGMTTDQATAALTPVLEERFGGVAEVRLPRTILRPTFAELGRAPDVAATLEAAMAVGRGATIEEQFLGRFSALTSGNRVEPLMTFDRAVLDAWVNEATAGLRKAPVAASVALVGRRLIITPDLLGEGVDRGAVAAKMAPALADPATTQPVEATATTVPLESETNDVDALATKTSVAQMARPVVVELGEKQWTFGAKRVRAWLRLAVGPHGSVPVVDPAAVRADVATLGKKVKRPARQTRFLVTKSGRKWGFVAGRPGRRLDTAATTQAVLATVLGRRMELPEGNPIRVATMGVPLKVTAEEAGKLVPQMTLLSSWTTFFPQGERNGNGVNIHLPARIINGTILKPGQIFDFVRTVGPFSWARGYRMGGIIRGDHTDPNGAVAGGICSASTTMFNAAVRAGLDILARDNHSYYITRYPLGLDATVSTMRGRIVQNMRFRNDTPHPIFISGQYGYGWVRFEMYAIEQTRKVSFSRPQVSDRIQAIDIVRRTSRLRAGQSERLEYPADGMNVAVTRNVTDMRGRLIHRDTFRTHYVRWNGILEVGTR
jgi:vancomycin resistance protein YoaR